MEVPFGSDLKLTISSKGPLVRWCGILAEQSRRYGPVQPVPPPAGRRRMLDAKALTQAKEAAPVAVIEQDRASLVARARHMVHGSFIFDPLLVASASYRPQPSREP